MITKADQGLLDELFKGVKTKEEQAMKTLKQEEELMKMEAEALKVLENNTMIGTDAWKETKAILQQTVQREQEIGEGSGSKGSDWQKLMNLLMQLRKVCNHPYQILNAEPDPYHTGDHVITASGKFIILEKLLNELVVKQKKKICEYFQFVEPNIPIVHLYLYNVSGILWLYQNAGSRRRTSLFARRRWFKLPISSN
jgi:SWI/SNF-related matrix-associated actin-dependent regulator of chromatin subfamily A member 5